MNSLRIDILTLFPGIFQGFLQESILKRIIDRGLVDIGLTNWRDYSTDKHRSVDDTPYGGGPGMVLRPEPIFEAVERIGAAAPREGMRRILLSPQGRTLTQPLLRELSQADRLVLLCGRYEGFDERVRLGLGFEELSIGDFVLNGGEVAAMAVVEGVIRLLPGALGAAESTQEESFSAGRLEYPQFTRPRIFKGMAVPEILLSGDHAKIARWRQKKSLEHTEQKRPDLLRSGTQEDIDRHDQHTGNI